MSDPAKPPPTSAVPDLGQTTALATRPPREVKRDAHGRLAPGTAALPGAGRPQGLAKRVREIVDFDKAIETLVEIAWGKLAPLAKTADRIKAIELLFDRGHGKAPQQIDMADKTPGATRDAFKSMPMEKLIATVEAMRALSASDKPSEG